MIEQICAYIHNFFDHGRICGTFTISGGTLELPELVTGQYFRIVGSRMNDGVYMYPPTDLFDETFEGCIWDMRPPRAFLDIVSEIESWNEQYGATVNSPYQSESFGGYSYTKASGNGANGSSVTGWQYQFKHRLNQWRKLC